MPDGSSSGCGPRVFSSIDAEPTARVEASLQEVQRTCSTSTSRWVQSAVRPVCRRAAQRGPRSRPMLVAPISRISGFLVHNGVADNLCVCVGGVGLEQVALADDEPCQRRKPPSSFAMVSLRPCRPAAGRTTSAPMLVSQLACLGDQLEVRSACSLPWRCSQNTHTSVKSRRGWCY